MCDTLVILPSHSDTGNLLFGKNSDREPTEAQAIVHLPAQVPNTAAVQCTYISIPQVERTHAVILSKPFQMWGAEMGVNEHGVAIGNEAVFTRIKHPKKNDGLTGMDMLRLALERTSSAEGALRCITGLLETYGQDACGGYQNKNFFYHNAFIIADKKNAWVLETAGRHWAAQKVTSTRSISNGLTITTDYDLLSKDAKAFAFEKKYLRAGEIFNFAKAYSDTLYTWASKCKTRQAITSSAIQQPQNTIAGIFSTLQTHNLPDEKFSPRKASSGSVCMHATSFLNPSETTGTMIVALREHQPDTIWLTGTSNPCTSLLKPFFFETNTLLENSLTTPSDKQDESLWWKAHRVHAILRKKYQKNIQGIKDHRNEIQAQLFLKEKEVIRDWNLKSAEHLSTLSLDLHIEFLIWLEHHGLPE